MEVLREIYTFQVLLLLLRALLVYKAYQSEFQPDERRSFCCVSINFSSVLSNILLLLSAKTTERSFEST